MRIMRQVLVGGVFLCLIVSPCVFSAQNQGINQISVAYSFEPAQVVGWLNGDKCATRYQVQRITGEPLVPYKTAHILVPAFTDVVKISVTGQRAGEIPVTDIPYSGFPIPISMADVDLPEAKPNAEIYGSDNPYPQEIYKVGEIDSFRGYKTLDVILYPVQFKPASKLVMYYTDMKVEVTLKPSTDKVKVISAFRGLDYDEEAVLELIDNPEALFSYYDAVGTKDKDSTNYEYIIITTQGLADEFQALAQWKANFVDGARVVTVSDKVSDKNIKNIINDYYKNHGTQYVLLGGDVGVITYHKKLAYIFPMYFAEIAEDYWYANLKGGDDISYYEVYIGRAPVDNEKEARDFVNKVIAYEQSSKPRANLFHQSRVQPGNVPDSRCLAIKCESWVGEDYTNYELFEENGGVTKSNWIDFWQNPGIMCAHIGHGNTNIYLLNYEEYEGEVRWTGSDVALMNNTFWPVHTSVACISGEFEAEDCLAEEYVKDPDNGAIAAIMNDKYGFFEKTNACAFSGEYVEGQFRALYEDGYENIGAMVAQSKHYLKSQAQSFLGLGNGAIYAWAWRELNLMGDPETPLLTTRTAP